MTSQIVGSSAAVITAISSGGINPKLRLRSSKRLAVAGEAVKMPTGRGKREEPIDNAFPLVSRHLGSRT